jgi:hypothetical protein
VAREPEPRVHEDHLLAVTPERVRRGLAPETSCPRRAWPRADDGGIGRLTGGFDLTGVVVRGWCRDPYPRVVAEVSVDECLVHRRPQRVAGPQGCGGGSRRAPGPGSDPPLVEPTRDIPLVAAEGERRPRFCDHRPGDVDVVVAQALAVAVPAPAGSPPRRRGRARSWVRCRPPRPSAGASATTPPPAAETPADGAGGRDVPGTGDMSRVPDPQVDRAGGRPGGPRRSPRARSSLPRSTSGEPLDPTATTGYRRSTPSVFSCRSCASSECGTAGGRWASEVQGPTIA